MAPIEWISGLGKARVMEVMREGTPIPALDLPRHVEQQEKQRIESEKWRNLHWRVAYFRVGVSGESRRGTHLPAELTRRAEDGERQSQEAMGIAELSTLVTRRRMIQ